MAQTVEAILQDKYTCTYVVDTETADEVATQWSRLSAAVILT